MLLCVFKVYRRDWCLKCSALIQCFVHNIEAAIPDSYLRRAWLWVQLSEVLVERFGLSPNSEVTSLDGDSDDTSEGECDTVAR